MKTDFDSSLIPLNFLYCMNSQCKQATTCLRYLLTTHIPAKHEFISILNPAYTVADNTECKHYMSDKKQRHALGITHLLDSIPHSDAVAIKKAMIAHFGHSTYYRFWRKERLISLRDQKYIRKLFLSRGIHEEPVYDEYIEQYEW